MNTWVDYFSQRDAQAEAQLLTRAAKAMRGLRGKIASIKWVLGQSVKELKPAFCCIGQGVVDLSASRKLAQHLGVSAHLCLPLISERLSVDYELIVAFHIDKAGQTTIRKIDFGRIENMEKMHPKPTVEVWI